MSFGGGVEFGEDWLGWETWNLPADASPSTSPRESQLHLFGQVKSHEC